MLDTDAKRFAIDGDTYIADVHDEIEVLVQPHPVAELHGAEGDHCPPTLRFFLSVPLIITLEYQRFLRFHA